jgi:hypothetical protein
MKRCFALTSFALALSASFLCAAPPAVTQRQTAATASAKRATAGQLSYENAVKFFRETLKERPLKVHQRCAVFFEGEYTSSNIYGHSVIILENSDIVFSFASARLLG